ncbi:MAG: 4'-phosphopantetheinyl transferase superfamily protein [Bacteroidota bacterium]|nr:4'-phosphopantetheinyl transferase superfamily protein [Bacteroidota bacterium]
MPLERCIKPDRETVAGIWKIEENADDLIAGLELSPLEDQIVHSYRNMRRKEQWLACRRILKEIYGKNYTLAYNEFGKPFLVNNPETELSLSHSGEYAAAIISRSYRIGIDIEKVSDRIHRVKERFLSEPELRHTSLHHNTEELYVYWGAKEALYKINGRPDIDFQKDIILEPFDYLCAGQCFAEIRRGSKPGKFEVSYEKIGNYIFVYALGKR